MIAEDYKQKSVSGYHPQQEIIDFTKEVQKDYQQGKQILSRSYVELNDMSPIERDNRDKRTFNAFVDESVEDPQDSWKFRGTRSKARNKATVMHSHLTAGYIFPSFLAQNEEDEEDIVFSETMNDCTEYLITNSDYRQAFLVVSMGMLVNCVTYMGADYAEIYQTIKDKKEEGLEKKEILDEVLSGFNAPIYSSDQVLISNAYEKNIQKHRFNIVERYIEYKEAEAMYGKHENWTYVSPGQITIFNEDQGVFYNIKDDDHPDLVLEVTYKNRRDDTEVCFLGGIYMGDMDIVENNPIKHRDNRGAPKYNIVPFGYQRISEHFFFFKSLMNAQYWDNNLLDAQYEIGMNRAFLETEMPLAVSGVADVDNGILFPNAVTSFEDKDVKVERLLPPADMGNIFNAMAVTEKSIDESSISDTSSGQLPSQDPKATAIAFAEKNAQVLLRGIGKNLAESMVQIGDLMKDIIINHYTIPQIENLSNGKENMKYRTFILNNKNIKGKNLSKVIKFDSKLLGKKMSKQQKEDEEMKMLEETGYPENRKVLRRINPELFAKAKYLTRIEPETMFAKNKEYMQAMIMNVYNTFKDNPYISLETITRKALYQFFDAETEDVMAKPKMELPEIGNILSENDKNPAPTKPSGPTKMKIPTRTKLSTTLPKVGSNY